MPNTLDLKPITLQQLTEGKIDGEGVFDRLMASIDTHLLSEHSKDRISGDSYAEVYLGGMQAAISQSIQFLLSKDKSTLDAALIEAQTRKIDAEIELIAVQKDLAEIEKRRANADINKIEQEISYSKSMQRNVEAEFEKILGEIKLLSVNTTLAERQHEIIDSDLLRAESELDKLKSELEMTEANVEIAKKQLLIMDSEIDKAGKQVELIDAELSRQPALLEKLRTENTLLTEQTEKVEQERLNLKAMSDKILSEIAILKQKKITEEAQTKDGASGVVGAQIKLYSAQRQGFTDDAKVKKVKAANDVYAIAKSNDPEAVSDPTNMLSTLESTLNRLL